MKKITIKISAKDIQEALKGGLACKTCPVARAVQRAMKNPLFEVGVHCAFDHSGVFLDLPKEVQSFIARFDARKPVKPFSFTISVPAA